MPDITLTTAIALCVAAAAAGWIDAVVGGGGLLQLPALLIGLPDVSPTYALGTNKAVAVTGTSIAAVTFARRSPLDRRLALRLGALALASSAGGALLASAVDKRVLQPLIMVMLLGVAAFVVLRPRFGTAPTERVPSRRRAAAALLVAGVGIGFYDGILGPGTGTFLVISLVALLHMNLLTASATAKVVNVGTNLGALAVFTAHGTVLWALAAPMAAFNMAGGWAGAHMALRRGSGFVRVVLLVVVTGLVTRLAWEQWWA
ncbi:TSUP family transporter [Streptomyces radicis]|uniref:Probable membrane transporter protein n=1 Tax=Streptomyces radicis TaxID=1750517 RepID=A0A3A9VZE5_9ACTN|nr:TSUP family transporter [Streptomyces radicis]RKN05543.1 sulfite exporter TauE/SafE family protein [Streptomyces radicis]RKN17412.1 sulfite exporter TauE/SafE family protein [Streptomyces radicis]